jgi:hypothetical protein
MKWTYLDTKLVLLRHDEGEGKSDDYCDGVEETDELLELVDWILDDLLNNDCEPQRVELRHVVTESGDTAKYLARIGF